jgi:hypothetical protein
MFTQVFALIALLAAALASSEVDQDLEVNKRISALKQRSSASPADFAIALGSAPFAGVFKRYVARNGRVSSKLAASTKSLDKTLPLVFLHGMGDSCFNGGMKSLTEESGAYLGK